MKEKQLFDLVNNIGEGLFMSLHIIDITDFGKNEKFRVYHNKGFCFNVEKQEDDLTEENEGSIDGYLYYFQSDLFDGFKQISIDEALKLIKNYKK